ncbi:MAG: rhamnogalacturonan acetylesterase [Opitutus sp.]|nr:rhamnogalacturonan acetylesterase [Opitutus sp.]
MRRRQSHAVTRSGRLIPAVARAFILAVAATSAFIFAPGKAFSAIAPASAVSPRLHLAGDSTLATKERATPNPEYGWGELLPRYFRDPAVVVNHAVNGRSTKSFLDEGRWQKLVSLLAPGDWVIIQFGHNDAKREDSARYTEPLGAFAANLRRFIADVRERGAHPVLATSVARRKWAEDGTHLIDTHGDYVPVVRDVAARAGVPLLELNALTTALEEAHGIEGSKRLHLWIDPGLYARKTEGWRDNTHYSHYGADRVAALAVQEIIRLQLPLADWLASSSPSPPPSAEK